MISCIGCVYNLIKIVFYLGLMWTIFHIITPDGAEWQMFLLIVFVAIVTILSVKFLRKDDKK